MLDMFSKCSAKISEGSFNVRFVLRDNGLGAKRKNSSLSVKWHPWILQEFRVVRDRVKSVRVEGLERLVFMVLPRNA